MTDQKYELYELNRTVKAAIIKLINDGDRLGENIQCNLNITRSYRISENVHSNVSSLTSERGGGGRKFKKKNF